MVHHKLIQGLDIEGKALNLFKEAPTHLKPNLTRILQESYRAVCLINQDTHKHTRKILRFSIIADEPDQRGGATVVFFTCPSFYSSEAQQPRTFVVKKRKKKQTVLFSEKKAAQEAMYPSEVMYVY